MLMNLDVGVVGNLATLFITHLFVVVYFFQQVVNFAYFGEM
jgi:hypothetical protein